MVGAIYLYWLNMEPLTASFGYRSWHLSVNSGMLAESEMNSEFEDGWNTTDYNSEGGRRDVNGWALWCLNRSEVYLRSLKPLRPK